MEVKYCRLQPERFRDRNGVKISAYDLRNLPIDLINFKDEVTTLLNYSKYQNLVLYESNSPTWTGREGETCYRYETSATAGWYNFYTYYYINSAWRWTLFQGVT